MSIRNAIPCGIYETIEKYQEGVNTFLEEYGVHEDGHASERAAAFIMGLLKEGN